MDNLIRLSGVTGAVLCMSAGAVHAQTILREARFAADVEGWGVLRLTTDCNSPLNAIAGTVTFQATGGNPDGQLQHIPPSEGRVSYWSAPASFLGDLTGAIGGVLSYDSRQNGSTGTAVERVIISNGTQTLFYSGTLAPRTLWRRFHVLLAPGGGWKVGSCTGPDVTPEVFQSVMSNVTQLLIHSEYGAAATNDGLDNVLITSPAESFPTSRFDAGLEDWWIFYDANYPTWDAKGGNPGGAMRVTDRNESQCWRFVAPAAFLGDHLDSLGRTLRFDLRADGDTACAATGIVELSGGGLTLSFTLPALEGSAAWRSYLLPLTPSPVCRRLSDGQPATAADFERVLGAVTSLTIAGEWVGADDIAYFDNVSLGSCEPSAFAAPGDGVCINQTLTLRAYAGGEGPLSYAWRRNGEPIDTGTNPSAATETLELGVGDVSDSGTYDVLVSNACGEVLSNAVVVDVCPADFNCDNAANSQDFFDFLTQFFESSPASDYNRDGLRNSQDFFDFLTAFFNGCG